MSKIILIVAACLLVASAALGFLNKGKLAAKQAALLDETAAKVAAQGDASKAKTGQQKAERATSEANAKVNDLQNSVNAANKQVTDLTSQVEDAKKSVTEKETQVAQLTDQLKAATASTGTGPTVTTSDLANQLKEAQSQREELKAVKDGLETQLKNAQTQLAGAQKRNQDRETQASMNGLHGRVLAVDRNWNFVVLDLGDRNGVVGNATMIVQRGSSMVGRIRITSVEPSQSIADIIPNSVPAGINMQPGDSVVFPGS